MNQNDLTNVTEPVDLEQYAKSVRIPPHAARYRIRIDKEYRVVEVPSMTGTQILALVGKTPQSHKLFQKNHGGQTEPIAANQDVKFTTPGIERFQTIPLDPTEGCR